MYKLQTQILFGILTQLVSFSRLLHPTEKIQGQIPADLKADRPQPQLDSHELGIQFLDQNGKSS